MPTSLEQSEHDESFRVLGALEDLAEDVVLGSATGLPKDLDEAANELRDRLASSLLSARRAARVQSTNRLLSEHEIVRRYARSYGYRTGPLALLAPPTRSDIEEAGKWSDHIAKLVRKRASESDVRAAVIRTKAKLSASARAVVDDAWSDERERVLMATAKEHVKTDIVPVVGTIWDARWDKRTCPACRDLDGKIRPIGTKFDGQTPGKTHIGCRCLSVLVFAPSIVNVSYEAA